MRIKSFARLITIALLAAVLSPTTSSFADAPTVTASTTSTSLVYNVSSAITPVSPITFTPSVGYSPAFNYTIYPILPAGLTLNPVTGQITGTPTTTSARTVYALTATDSTFSSDTATGIFYMTVTNPSAAPAFTYAQSTYYAPVTSTFPAAITNNSISTGGNIQSFFLNSGDPTLFSVNSMTGMVTLLQNLVYSVASQYTISIGARYNSTYATPVSLTINVVDPVNGNTPAFTLSTSSQTLIANLTSGGFSTFSTGGPITSWSISSVPAGMSFDTTTGYLSGTPTQSSLTPLDLVVTGTNTAGSTSQHFMLYILPNSYTRVSSGKVALYINQSEVAGGTTISGYALLNEPIICENIFSVCDAQIAFISSDSTHAFITPNSASWNPTNWAVAPSSPFSPTTLTWSSANWNSPIPFAISTSGLGLTNQSVNVNIASIVASGSEYYNSYKPTALALTIHDALWSGQSLSTPIPVPDPVQSSKLTSYTPETVTVGSPTSISATGIFDRTISNISLNGVLIPLTSWTQTATSVVVSPLTFAAGTNFIQIFNGAVPLLSPLKLTGTNTNKSSAVALTSSKITYIRCVNGNRIRIAFGHSPSCPSGYAKG